MNVTTEELYEQTKKILRGTFDERLWSEDRPFILACSFCGLAFQDDAEQGMILQHMEISHPESLEPDENDTSHISLDLVWIGEGPPPEAQV